MNNTEQKTEEPPFFTPACTPSEPPPKTAGDVGRELGKSVTTVKELARQTKAPVTKTPGGLWIFSAVAVEKLRLEIRRREQEASRK